MSLLSSSILIVLTLTWPNPFPDPFHLCSSIISLGYQLNQLLIFLHFCNASSILVIQLQNLEFWLSPGHLIQLLDGAKSLILISFAISNLSTHLCLFHQFFVQSLTYFPLGFAERPLQFFLCHCVTHLVCRFLLIHVGVLPSEHMQLAFLQLSFEPPHWTIKALTQHPPPQQKKQNQGKKVPMSKAFYGFQCYLPYVVCITISFKVHF